MRKSILKCTFVLSTLLIISGLALAQHPAGPPPEGTAWRAIVGDNFVNKTGLKMDVELEVGLTNSDTGDGSGTGGANMPSVPGDTGFVLSDFWYFIHRDMKAANIMPIVTPLPGPTPKKFDWSLMGEIDYGRDSQPARMSGWDTHWDVNEPAASSAAFATEHKFNFVAMPELYTQMYFPVWKGMTIRAGRWGDMVTLEIPPNPSGPNPNYFYTHGYSFLADVTQVFGWLASVNVMRSHKNGWMDIEFGTNQGDMTLHSYSNTPFRHVEYALRWRSPHMTTWVDYQARIGDGEIHVKTLGAQFYSTDFNNSNIFIMSPKHQLKQRHELIINHEVGKHWALTAEGNYLKQAGNANNTLLSYWLSPRGVGVPFPGTYPMVSFNGDHAWGLLGRAVYKFNPKFSIGSQIETFHDSTGYFLFPVDALNWTEFGGTLAGPGKGSFNEFQFGANFNPNKFFRIRPEFRHDWADSKIYGSAAGKPSNSQNEFAMDLITWF
jgi:hypothetical protein